jgi:predicted RNase H-like HicB family nuclease
MRMQARAVYRVGIEDIEPGHWVTFVFDLPGCFSTGPSREASLAGTPAAIDEHLAWLARHGGMAPPAGAPIRLEVVEEFRSFVGEGDYIVNACLVLRFMNSGGVRRPPGPARPGGAGQRAGAIGDRDQPE